MLRDGNHVHLKNHDINDVVIGNKIGGVSIPIVNDHDESVIKLH